MNGLIKWIQHKEHKHIFDAGNRQWIGFRYRIYTTGQNMVTLYLGDKIFVEKYINSEEEATAWAEEKLLQILTPLMEPTQ